MNIHELAEIDFRIAQETVDESVLSVPRGVLSTLYVSLLTNDRQVNGVIPLVYSID